ncbi:class I tRNA ligase family protein, partial [Mycobacterium tuberculosis]
AADLSEKLAELTSHMEGLELRRSAQALRAIWVLGNEYLTEAAPWTAVKTDRERAAVVVRTGLNLVALFARLSRPFIPATTELIAAGVGDEAALDAWPSA